MRHRRYPCSKYMKGFTASKTGVSPTAHKTGGKHISYKQVAPMAHKSSSHIDLKKYRIQTLDMRLQIVSGLIILLGSLNTNQPWFCFNRFITVAICAIASISNHTANQ